jgi:hypothetical protein
VKKQNTRLPLGIKETMDVWFARLGSSIWCAWAEPGEPPINLPIRVTCVADAYKYLREAGIEIGQVGITDSEMLGLEDCT